MSAERFDGFIRRVEEQPERFCTHVRRAVARQRRDVASPPAGCEFSPPAGLRVCRWIEANAVFTASQFARRPFVLQPWQVFFVVCAFGWLRGAARRFRHLHLWVPRKAGKSELAAAIGLFMLLEDGEANPLVCSTASSEQQARIVPTAAWRMLSGFSAETTERYRVKRNRMTQRNPPVVEIDGGAGAFRGLPRDIGGSLDGLSPHCAIIDELHSYRSSDTYSAMAEGMGARNRGVLLITSTAGDIVGGIGQQQFDLAVSILAGDTHSDDVFALVFDAPRDLPIDAESTWELANPSLGVTVPGEYLRSRCAEAVATGQIDAFRRKQLNQWPLAHTGDDAWLDGAAWDAAGGLVGKAGRRAWVGVAMAGGGHATALLWRTRKRWCALIRLWERDRDAVRWIRRQALKRHLTVALDPVRSAPVRSLEAEGIGCVTVERTARNLALPMQALAEHVSAGTFRHRSPPAVRDQVVGMGAVRTPDGLTRPAGDAPEAPIALLNALAIALVDDTEPVTMRDIPEWDSI